VGIKGSRVQSIVQELRGEKIDIVPWVEDPVKFVCKALSPAEVSEVIIDEDAKAMEIIVQDDQLSLAIGKKGQNVRLASRLVGWKLDIKSASKKEKQFAEAVYALGAIPGVGLATAEVLYREGIATVADLVDAGVDFLANIESIGQKKADKIYASAQAILEGRDVPEAVHEQGDAAPSLESLEGVGEKTRGLLVEGGFDTIDKIAASSVEELSQIPGIGEKKAHGIIESAKRLVTSAPAKETDSE
jgi:N utilization substance protein A